jgi:hypothetical protein
MTEPEYTPTGGANSVRRRDRLETVAPWIDRLHGLSKGPTFDTQSSSSSL